MAFYQARSGVCRSGVTYCGWTPPLGALKINGVDRSALWKIENCVINLNADGQPSTMTLDIDPDPNDGTSVPSTGNEVIYYYATPNDIVFQGRILQMNASKLNKTLVRYQCTATGDTWLIDRYDHVLANYQSRGVNTIVADILYRFTDGSFRVGYIDRSLGDISISIDDTVMGALTRIAKQVNGYLEISPFDGASRIVNIYQTYPDAGVATVTGDNSWFQDFSYRVDFTQARSRSLIKGKGTTTSALVPAGSTTIPVDDVSLFASLTGGSAILDGLQIISYTGATSTLLVNGVRQGYLTGVSGVTRDAPAGAAVNVLGVFADSSVQAAFATKLGGGLSGQMTNYLADEQLSDSEAVLRSFADISTFGADLPELSWTNSTVQRWLRPGRPIAVSYSVPLITGAFFIREVTIRPLDRKMTGQFTGFRQTVFASQYLRTVTDLLSQLAG